MTFHIFHGLVALSVLMSLPVSLMGERGIPVLGNIMDSRIGTLMSEVARASPAAGATQHFIKSKAGESCADLINKQTHFAIKVNVGTPAQTFELVADTGSDATIVESCVCRDHGMCPPESNCFKGTRSETFLVSKGVGANSSQAGPMGVSMTFGSGTVASVVATDVVQVAGVSAEMKDGLLLMVDRRQLNVAGPFEGILGLGPEKKASESNAAPRRGLVTGGYAPKLFLQEAGVERFSICFNDRDQNGSLRLNVPELQNPVPAIGSFHWGMALQGISVGSSSAPAIFCEPGSMKQGQKTPCGAIPDSGTTLMMGPKDQVSGLFDHLCENWERCRNARTSQLSNMTGSHAFQTLLFNCGSWMKEGASIDEIPSVFLTLGDNQKIELTPWAYITETVQEEYKHAIKHLFGVIPVIVDMPTGKSAKVCVPSFGVQEYNTKENGPVWIMGTPLFYQFTVGYSQNGPSISFSNQTCSKCSDRTPSFLSKHRQLFSAGAHQAHPMRVVSGAPRVPYYDKSLPL